MKPKGILRSAVGIFVLVVVLVALLRHHGSSAQTTTAAAPAASAPTARPKDQFMIVVSQSSCQESPADAEIRCSVGVKNRGSMGGRPTVYAEYFYSDSGSSTDESDNGECRASDVIPAGQLGFVYFCHPYNGLQHDVIRAAVSLKVDANAYPYVPVVAPGVAWP